MNRFPSYLNQRDFESSFYFRTVKHTPIHLSFEIEGTEPVWLSRVELYAQPDAMCREFENGVVLVNPSPTPQVFDVSELFPGVDLRRLAGSPMQDPVTNDTRPVDTFVDLLGKDGLFLVKE